MHRDDEDQQQWRQLKLSLERPYKDDNGQEILQLEDITPDGQHIYEQKVTPIKALRTNLHRILAERGTDFFEVTRNNKLPEKPAVDTEEQDDTKDDTETESTSNKTMTVEDLHKMTMELLPKLYVSLGEMTFARDLLSSLLGPAQASTSSTRDLVGSRNTPSNAPPAVISSDLSTTIVTKPPPIVSVQAFNSQLTIGSKDEALRHAVTVFKTAAESMDRARLKGEKYWVDALKARRGNWRLMPAPLPLGTIVGKGTDRTSKDFLVAYGLEESPPTFRRQALARLGDKDTTQDDLVFLHRPQTRLKVTLNLTDQTGNVHTTSYMKARLDTSTVDTALKDAQSEVVEQEIFAMMVLEAGNLPSASARVSERQIVVEAAQNTELQFELLDSGVDVVPTSTGSTSGNEQCQLIYHALHALLLRRHAHVKKQRLGAQGLIRAPSTSDPTHRPPSLLQPIVDYLQYQVFCQRVRAEIDKMVGALKEAGIPTRVQWDAVHETGAQLGEMLKSNKAQSVGGETILRIDDRHIIRLTFRSPSTLVAHLPQATLTITSIPQLSQLLADEVDRCLLQRICEIGASVVNNNDGAWFVDLSRCIGRWDGCVLTFRIVYDSPLRVNCEAYQLHQSSGKGAVVKFTPGDKSPSLLKWVENTVRAAAVVR